MMESGAYDTKRLPSILMAILVILVSLQNHVISGSIDHFKDSKSNHIDFSSHVEAWNPNEQPWAQFGGIPSHNGPIPEHDPDGGPGQGSVTNVEVLDAIVTPVINWQAFESNEADSYGSVIGDFSQSITAPEQAKERCGNNTLFPVMITSEISNGNLISTISIVSGDDAKIAWEGEIGQSREVRATPIIHDINGDEKPEIIVVYDTDSAFHIDVWSPELTCTNSTWEESGHSNELIWSYSNPDVRISSPLPHLPTSESGHFAVTQPLLADLDLDGSPNLIVALVDDPDSNPVPELMAFDLTMNTPTTPKWSISLDRGSHPSDPVFAQLDSSNTVVLLTTIDSNSGNMWIWKIDGATGSILWERVAVQGTDTGDDEAPRMRLPGPIIVQLDSDSAPEMVITIPTDPTGRTSGTGAKFVGMEITSTDEIFSFRAPNGYADTQPVAIDIDDDGRHDRLCWVTWYSESAFNFNREGLLGCHDISNENPSQEWTRNLQRGGGNDNDEIAVSPPFWMDINGDSTPEILVAFGKRLYAFDGDTGSSADASDGWSTPLGMPHRTWAAPALADVDGDGAIDILIGDTLISEARADLEPTSDGRAISFNPNQANPGQEVTITGQFSNVGTDDPDANVDVLLLLDGVEINRQRFTEVSPSAPSGNGGPLTITATVTAELGIHSVELVLDIYNNITEAREDNNHAQRNLMVVEPYVAEIYGPEDTPRIVPGLSELVEINLMSTGSKTEDWTLSWDDSNLPEGWTFSPVDPSQPTYLLDYMQEKRVGFQVSIPETALGDENGIVHFTLTLNSNTNITEEFDLQLEVFRTRGLSLLGPSGIQFTSGQGRIGNIAQAWLLIENIGNAPETTTTLDWTSNTWGATPKLKNSNGDEIFNIQLGPGESQELFAELQVPSTASYEDSTTTELTICIGSSSELTCAEIDILFVVKQFTVSPHHQRSLPDNTLQWNIVGELPADGSISWNMASASMMNSGWEWNSTGDLVVSSTTMSFSGSSSDVVAGTLILTLPEYAAPMRHSFNGIDGGIPINFSLQVLQQFRTGIQILSPSNASLDVPISYNVSEQHRILLGIENSGNGEDTFVLSAAATSLEGESLDEFVTIDFLTPTKNIDARSSGVGSVDITLSNELPALETFKIDFYSTSLGQQDVVEMATLYLNAAPNRDWSISLQGDSEREILPGSKGSVQFQLKNIGNAPDQLTTATSITYTYNGQDDQTWQTTEGTTLLLDVNNTSTISVEFEVPQKSWAGTVVEMNIAFRSDGFVLSTERIIFSVLQKSGWKFNLSGMNLEVEPDGSNVSLRIDHLGNSPEIPFVYKYSSGWTIHVENLTSTVGPFGTIDIQVHVLPPSNAFAGEIEEILFQISDNDGSGASIESIPFRVASKPNISLDARGHWKVSEGGGFPAAWIVNHGNDIAQITIEIEGLPTDWNTRGPMQMTLAPHELQGLPIELLPPSDWDGFEFLAQIRVTHPELPPEFRSILVKHSNLTWASSPVVSNYDTLESKIFLSEMDNLLLSSTQNGIQLKNSNDGNVILITHGSNNGQITLDFVTMNEEYNLTMFVTSWSYPNVEVTCQLMSSFFGGLTTNPFNGTFATCEFSNFDESAQRLNALLSDQYGVEYDLEIHQFLIDENSTRTVNLSLTSTTFSKGQLTFQLRIIDQLGKIVDIEAIDTVVRPTGWNIGIQSFTANGDLQIGILRPGYEILEDEYCEITIVSEDGWSFTKYVDITSSAYAPIIVIEDPGVLQNDERITATLRCTSPYDVDDNPEDNMKSTYYKQTASDGISSSKIIWMFSTTIVLILLAWLTGFISSRPKMKKENHQQKIEKPSETIPNQSKSKKLDDDISLEVIDDGGNISFEESLDESNDEFLTDLLVEHTERIPKENQNASNRLRFIREEMDPSKDANRQGSIEDRMKKFFDEK